MSLRLTALTAVLICFFPLYSLEVPDTTHSNLEEVVVTGHHSVSETIPSMTLQGKELENLNSHSVADAMRYFSGVQVKDYGGVGGIKTINVRSMGTNHTGVVYDGVELGNAQNGQVDLGQLSLDNIEAISLYNGQKSNILQPAKDFGTAATVYLRTKTPEFEEKKPYNVKAVFKTGSFDLINPAVTIELRLSRRVNASLSAEWLNSSGKYKFRYRRVTPSGETAYDTTAVRQNGDINATRLEINLNGTLRNGNWQAKAYNYNSERGIPGAIVNNVWRRGERVWDNNSFIQGNYSGFFGKFSTLNHLKYGAYKTHYVNNDDRQLKVDNVYRQKELYLSSANQYEILNWWNVSVSYDFMWTTMSSDIYDFSKPDRFSNFIAAATSLDFKRIKGLASLQTTFVNDTFRTGKPSQRRRAVSPAVYISGEPLRNKNFSLRAFYKRSFRMPTFNDLYYAEYGNSQLSPERVTQYNLGAAYNYSGNGLIAAARLSADAYYNKVKDKIVAYPKGQQFRWTMLNLGKVDIRGIDLSGLITIQPYHMLSITLRGQYTFQRAIDVTSPKDSYYKNQIPYIPRHSGSVVGNIEWRGWYLNYSWIYVGQRYNQQENIIYNYMQPWYTSDLSLGKSIQIKRVTLKAQLEINNLFSQDYDVILNYPMPKRNYMFTVSVAL